MFHGTSSSSIDPICQDGLHLYSSFTASFDYSICRSGYKDKHASKEVKVLAMAVLIESD
jgi:hypothetical protein